MEILYILVSIISLVWCILCLILFFKIWGMTNNVKDIKNFLIYNIRPNDNIPTNAQNRILSTEENASSKKEQNSFGLKVGDKVQHKTRYTDKIMIVGYVNTDGSCFCTNEKGKTYGTFNADELMKV